MFRGNGIAYQSEAPHGPHGPHGRSICRMNAARLALASVFVIACSSDGGATGDDAGGGAAGEAGGSVIGVRPPSP
jgi:hypothetical protein